MRLTLDALHVLDAINRAGSFAAAAEQLYRVPSAVSYTIHKLEQDLGVAIFDRSGHRAKLTDAGLRLLEEGRELLRLAEAIECRVKEAGAGVESRLSIVVADVLPRATVYSLLRSFHEVPSHAPTQLQVTMSSQAACWDALQGGRADLVIGAPEPNPRDATLGTQELGEVELSLVVPCAHPLALSHEPVPSQISQAYRLIRQVQWPFSERPTGLLEKDVIVDGYDSQLEAIRQGLGVGFVPAYLAADDVGAGVLVTKEVAGAPRLRLTVAWRAARVGHGLSWLLDRLRDRALRARLVSHVV
jgi:DNA-binding transcriptional LysR family regulator